MDNDVQKEKKKSTNSKSKNVSQRKKSSSKSNSNLDWYYENTYKKNVKSSSKKAAKDKDNKNIKPTKTVKKVNVTEPKLQKKKTTTSKQNNDNTLKKEPTKKTNNNSSKVKKRVSNDIEPKKKCKKTIDLEETIIERKIDEKELKTTKELSKESSKNLNLKNDNKKIKSDKTLYGKNIPLYSNDKESKKTRRKIYLKESLFLAIPISFVNVITPYIFDDIMIINITTNEYLNVLASFIISFILFFIITYSIDMLITSIIVHINIKKKLKSSIDDVKD